MSRMRGHGAKAVALLAPAIDLRHLTTGRDATSSVDAIAAKGWPAKLQKTRPRRGSRFGEIDAAALPPDPAWRFENRKSNF
jgi:hypothetical protein